MVLHTPMVDIAMSMVWRDIQLHGVDLHTYNQNLADTDIDYNVHGDTDTPGQRIWSRKPSYGATTRVLPVWCGEPGCCLHTLG